MVAAVMAEVGGVEGEEDSMAEEGEDSMADSPAVGIEVGPLEGSAAGILAAHIVELL